MWSFYGKMPLIKKKRVISTVLEKEMMHIFSLSPNEQTQYITMKWDVWHVAYCTLLCLIFNDLILDIKKSHLENGVILSWPNSHFRPIPYFPTFLYHTSRFCPSQSFDCSLACLCALFSYTAQNQSESMSPKHIDVILCNEICLWPLTTGSALVSSWINRERF